MIKNISGKKLLVNLVIALICIVLFSGLIPFLCILLIDLFQYLVVSFFDSLPMSDSTSVTFEYKELWKVFGGVAIVQSIFTIPASISVCVAIGFLTEKVKTGWIYLLGMAVSFAIFGVFQFISFVIASFIAEEAFVFFWYLFTSLIVIFFSTIVGLILVVADKKL